ncbi:MAG: 4Fe-4S dicluster domain-containing protein [Candidatus Omnitrophota bacterium]
MNKLYYSDSAQFNAFFNGLKKNYRVFSPYLKDAQAEKPDYHYQCLPSEEDPLVFNPYRAVEPLKTFFTRPHEKLTDYFTSHKNIRDIPEKTVIFGVKSCDLFGHKVQDFVFLEGVEVDALYRLRRENTIFISSDCTDFKEVCHCLAWEVLPYPQEGFDLNLSPLNDGYVVETGSKKGEELIALYKQYFTPARETQAVGRKAKRDNLVERLKKQLLPQELVTRENVQKLVREGYNLDTWKEFMLTCVECGGCNLICDTCHCFLLSDDKAGRDNAKFRQWDSCQYANFSRVAGGANPLKTRTQRLRNRFMKKFDFFIDNLGMPACCGCGRCIEVCPGKIDIREVLKDLARRLKSKS